MGRPREVVETAAVEPGGAGGRMHRGLLCGRGGGVVSLHTTARRPWEEPARSSSPRKPGWGLLRVWGRNCVCWTVGLAWGPHWFTLFGAF